MQTSRGSQKRLIHMTASCWENLITAPDLYISIHVCLRESDWRARARANAAHARVRSPDVPLLGGSGGEDKRVLDLKATMERCIRIRYYRLARCRVGPAGADAQRSHRCDAAAPEEVHRCVSSTNADSQTALISAKYAFVVRSLHLTGGQTASALMRRRDLFKYWGWATEQVEPGRGGVGDLCLLSPAVHMDG